MIFLLMGKTQRTAMSGELALLLSICADAAFLGSVHLDGEHGLCGVRCTLRSRGRVTSRQCEAGQTAVSEAKPPLLRRRRTCRALGGVRSDVRPAWPHQTHPDLYRSRTGNVDWEVREVPESQFPFASQMRKVDVWDSLLPQARERATEERIAPTKSARTNRPKNTTVTSAPKSFGPPIKGTPERIE